MSDYALQFLKSLHDTPSGPDFSGFISYPFPTKLTIVLTGHSGFGQAVPSGWNTPESLLSDSSPFLIQLKCPFLQVAFFDLLSCK